MSTRTELQKALTTTGDGAALVTDSLDPALWEELLKLQPLAQLLEVQQAEAKVHEYKVRSSHPMGWFEGEATPANNKNSVYATKTVATKIQRAWGSVTGFAQAMDERFVNALATELEGTLEGISNLFEYSVLWGTSNDIGFTGDAYQYSGILPRVFAYAPANVIDGGGNKITLDDLDAAIAKAAAFRGVQNDQRAWFMGLRMKQVVDGLQTRVQIPLTTAELAEGRLVMSAYGRAGILETDYVVPAGATSVGSPTATSAAGGSLTASTTYHYKISSITAFGEQEASASFNGTTGAGEGTLDLAWTADANAKLYMIFRGSSSSNQVLIDIIPALTYDANGTVNGSVETYSDTGAKTPITQVKPLLTGEQNIVLANLNPRRGLSVMGKIDDMGRPIDNVWSFVELARTKDSWDYMLKSYQTLKLVYPNLFSCIRHVTVS